MSDLARFMMDDNRPCLAYVFEFQNIARKAARNNGSVVGFSGKETSRMKRRAKVVRATGIKKITGGLR